MVHGGLRTIGNRRDTHGATMYAARQRANKKYGLDRNLSAEWGSQPTTSAAAIEITRPSAAPPTAARINEYRRRSNIVMNVLISPGNASIPYAANGSFSARISDQPLPAVGRLLPDADSTDVHRRVGTRCCPMRRAAIWRPEN